MQRSYEIGGRHLEIFFGDITDLPVDAIVNSENSDLLMDASCGPSVSAAIRRIEGEEFARETVARGPLELGSAVAVPAHKVRARFVIHAATVKKVAPDKHETSPEAIARAVRSSLAVASSLGLKSVAMPAFGVRAARLPREVASELMIDGIVEHLSKPTSLERVVLALLDPKSFLVFFERAILRARAATAPLVLDLERRGDDLLARFEGSGAVASVERGASSARDLDHARERLDRLARSRDRGLAGRVSELRATGGFVWSFLLPESVRERLAQTPSRTLVLRTGEELASVPWELAWDGEAFLSERFSVARALVAEGVVSKKGRRASRPRVLVIAAPTADLEQAFHEGESLLEDTFASGVSAELLGGERATRSRVLERLAGVSAIHFAGHERNMAWALADGELAPRDISRLEGVGLRFVFANACARVDARERLALGRAFLIAGAESYVGSLWEVEDEAARQFATVVWQELLRGASTGDALQRARASGRASASVDWAAYVHFGDPLDRPFSTD